MPGKKNTTYATVSITPRVRGDQRSQKKSVRMCAPTCRVYAAPSMNIAPYSM